MTSLALLDDRAIVAVSGPEATGFLQGLITNDVRSLAEGAAIYAALLTPQGKILFDFLVARRGDALLLDCRADAAGALAKRLLLYRLRSKVAIERRDDLAVLAAWDDARLPEPDFPDPRLPALGRRAIVERDGVPADAAGAQIYLALRLDCGVPEGTEFGEDRIFALDADLEELHGVSFEKGCYVGQELTARMKHRSTARKRIFPVRTADGRALAAPETPVRAGSHELGTILSTYADRGFALLRLDRLTEAGTAQLHAAEIPLLLAKPAWLSA